MSPDTRKYVMVRRSPRAPCTARARCCWSRAMATCWTSGCSAAPQPPARRPRTHLVRPAAGILFAAGTWASLGPGQLASSLEEVISGTAPCTLGVYVQQACKHRLHTWRESFDTLRVASPPCVLNPAAHLAGAESAGRAAHAQPDAQAAEAAEPAADWDDGCGGGGGFGDDDGWDAGGGAHGPSSGV